MKKKIWFAKATSDKDELAFSLNKAEESGQTVFKIVELNNQAVIVSYEEVGE